MRISHPNYDQMQPGNSMAWDSHMYTVSGDSTNNNLDYNTRWFWLDGGAGLKD